MIGVPYYASWDPGGSKNRRTTGLTYWTKEAKPLDCKSMNEAEFDEELNNFPDSVKVFIVEGYRPFGHINHTGNKLSAPQRLGDIKGFARRRQIKIIEQQSSILPIAAKWAGYKWDRNKHVPDHIASYLHGYYYLTNLGLIRLRVLDK